MTDLLKNLKKKFGATATVEATAKDITIKSKDRDATFAETKKLLKTNKVTFTEVFKVSKSSSMNVLSVPDHGGDIIFKPIIQKGAGGVEFEHELEADLTNWWAGFSKRNLKHADVISEMEKVLKFTQKDGWKIIPMGSKNQRRKLAWDGSSLSVSNSTGATLTDLTLENKTTKKLVYLSLKMSKSFYVLSAAIEEYFANKNQQVALCDYLGIDGYKWGGFGAKYRCVTKKKVDYNKVKNNIEEFLTKTYGTDVVIVHKKIMNDVKVSKIAKGSFAKISLDSLNVDSYVYPEPGVRKYAVIKLTGIIDGSSYKIDFQFRGTTAADTGPKYLRILLERL
jgi:hypothetical protein